MMILNLLLLLAYYKLIYLLWQYYLAYSRCISYLPCLKHNERTPTLVIPQILFKQIFCPIWIKPWYCWIMQEYGNIIVQYLKFFILNRRLIDAKIVHTLFIVICTLSNIHMFYKSYDNNASEKLPICFVLW